MLHNSKSRIHSFTAAGTALLRAQVVRHGASNQGAGLSSAPHRRWTKPPGSSHPTTLRSRIKHHQSVRKNRHRRAQTDAAHVSTAPLNRFIPTSSGLAGFLSPPSITGPAARTARRASVERAAPSLRRSGWPTLRRNRRCARGSRRAGARIRPWGRAADGAPPPQARIGRGPRRGGGVGVGGWGSCALAAP